MLDQTNWENDRKQNRNSQNMWVLWKDVFDELHKQVAIVAHWLCGMSGKNSLLLVGGCGNGKTTFVYAMQNLVNHLGIKNQVTGQNFGISLYNAKDLANICKTHSKDWRSLMDKDILAIDDLGTEPREIIEYIFFSLCQLS